MIKSGIKDHYMTDDSSTNGVNDFKWIYHIYVIIGYY